MTNQQAPSADEIPQPTAEERKHFAEHNNSRIINYTEAPSATVDEILESFIETKDKQYGQGYFCTPDVIERIRELHSQQEKSLSTEQRQAIFNVFHINGVLLMDDELNAIESIVYPRTYPYTLKDEQQEKRYTREEMEQCYVGGWDAAKTHNEGETYLIFSEWLDQFDKEGK